LGTGSISTIATGDGHLTPIDDELPCPVCSKEIPLAEFRHEAIGEVWTREAAQWAEEGVCPACYRDILPPYVREWSDGEWLSHHHEGWRNTVEAVTQILKYQDSAQESWLPPEERHRLLDIEATLSARREHLALCQSAMEDLLQRYPSSMAPPPFEYLLVAARDQGLSETVLTELKEMRRQDVVTEDERREVSMRVASSEFKEAFEAEAMVQRRNPAPIPKDEVAAVEEPLSTVERQRWPSIVAAVLVFGVLLWLLLRDA
jgi:hypothetical protein